MPFDKKLFVLFDLLTQTYNTAYNNNAQDNQTCLFTLAGLIELV